LGTGEKKIKEKLATPGCGATVAVELLQRGLFMTELVTRTV
jgi:hypothetical protein